MSIMAPGGPLWIGAYPSGVAWDWTAPSEPLPAAFERARRDFGQRTCIDFLDRLYSYEEVGRLVDRAARGLQDLGVVKGTRVGLLLPNTPYFVVLYYAILKLGAVVVNFDPLAAEPELRRQVADSGARLMVTLDLKLLLPKLAPALDEGLLERVIVCPMAEILPGRKKLLFTLLKRGERAAMPAGEGYLPFARLIANDGRFTPTAIEPAVDLAVLQYTGGTTGTPKAAMLSHANLVANREQLHAWCPSVERGREVMLGVLPFFHVFAMTTIMNLGLGLGATLVLLPRFEIAQMLRAIDRKKPTLMAGVPALFNALNLYRQLDRYDLSSLRICICGGASLPAEVRRTFEARTGCRLLEGYGLSEASPVCTCNPVEGGKDGTIGLPLPGTYIELRDPERPERAVPPGEIGEVCVRGPQVMRGYWNRREESAAAFVDGLLRTGDLGIMDEDGYIRIVDRLKDVILTNGYTVYPRMIEEAIYAHDAVAEVTVIGLPDPQRGECAKAFVRLKQGRLLSEEALRHFLEARLSPVELPRAIEFREELPKTRVGKLSKKELVAEERARRAAPPPAPPPA